jgi:uncharacterized membrane protein
MDGTLRTILLVILTTFSPAVEINGSIPLGITLGLDPLQTFIIAIIANIILFFPVFFGLKLLYDSSFSRIKLFNKYLKRVRERGKSYIDKYGYIGLTAFIALPSPLTGVYTGSILAWLLDMDWKKSAICISLAVVINGLIVLGITLGSLTFLSFLF